MLSPFKKWMKNQQEVTLMFSGGENTIQPSRFSVPKLDWLELGGTLSQRKSRVGRDGFQLRLEEPFYSQDRSPQNKLWVHEGATPPAEEKEEKKKGTPIFLKILLTAGLLVGGVIVHNEGVDEENSTLGWMGWGMIVTGIGTAIYFSTRD